jgi:DNA-binding PadR family transcriptional regulator
MFRHLILGLLRDGQPRHGYGLMTEYRTHSGDRISVGNLYRELAHLAAQGLVQSGVNPPDADPRRIPYQITEHGRHFFDQWLVSAPSHDGEFSTKLIFVDQMPADALARLLDRWQEELWIRGKALAREREDTLARQPPESAQTRYNSRPALLSRRLKHVTAELEFLEEFRADFDSWAERRRAAVDAARPKVPSAGRGPVRRDKGSGVR